MRGYTVEMSFLMPIILLLIMSSIYAVFYFHDKNIIAGAAYETVVVGSTKAREKEGVSEEELNLLFRERVDGKCILLTDVSGHVNVTKDDISVTASASFARMSVSLKKRASITEPERNLRDRKKLKELIDGT